MANSTLGPPTRGGTEPTGLEVRDALERILRSRGFENAGRASDFLRFVVTETLAERGDRLKGYAIALHVFGRSPDFDAQSDPLVRVEALRLRQGLTEYYAGEGAAEPVRLELPRGGYAVKAVYVTPADLGPAAPVDSAHARPRIRLRGARTAWGLAAALLLAVIAAWVLP